jgi:hypothetical protein
VVLGSLRTLPLIVHTLKELAGERNLFVSESSALLKKNVDETTSLKNIVNSFVENNSRILDVQIRGEAFIDEICKWSKVCMNKVRPWLTLSED